MNLSTCRNSVIEIPSDPIVQAFRQAFLVAKLVPALGPVTANTFPCSSLGLEILSKGCRESSRVSHAWDRQQTSATVALLEANS